MSCTEIMTFLFRNIFIVKELRAANFADIIKIETMFTKISFQNSKKVERSTTYVSKRNLYLYSLI